MILPSAALAELTSREVQYPMMFRVENPARGTHTHCGVSEFTAAVGKCHLPYWIMENLMVPESAMVTVRNVQLPKGRFVKFQPHSADFTRISNPRAVLEKVLRAYSALTKGDTLKLQYAEKVYWVDVLEVKPAVRCVLCAAVAAAATSSTSVSPQAACLTRCSVRLPGTPVAPQAACLTRCCATLFHSRFCLLPPSFRLLPSVACRTLSPSSRLIWR